jgi:hypothetical protein
VAVYPIEVFIATNFKRPFGGRARKIKLILTMVGIFEIEAQAFSAG